MRLVRVAASARPMLVRAFMLATALKRVEPMAHDTETAEMPKTSQPTRVGRITAVKIPNLSGDDRRKWAEGAIKEGKVFEYVSGQWP
jgi:hypothetical protein